MKFTHFPILMILALGLMSSCKKTATGPTDNVKDTVSGVFAVSYTLTKGWATATVWRNGVATKLPDNYPSMANAVTIKDNIIYIAGSSTEFTDTYQPTCWINGSKNLLTDSGAFANSIITNGNDIYIVGYMDSSILNDTTTAVYWKNGKKTKLNSGNPFSQAHGISILGSNLYIVGSIGGTFNRHAVYWKNNQLVKLPEGKGTGSGASNITTYGGDVYIAGYVSYHNGNSAAAYWKNGQLMNLADSLTYSTAVALAVKGSDLYVVGTNGSSPVYWKNGQLVTLHDGFSDSGEATSIAFDGNDIYIGGGYSNGSCYWKNDAIVPLREGLVVGMAVVHP